AEPFHHAQHYVGFSHNVDQRVDTHLTGYGSKLTQAVVKAGIEIQLARVWPDGDMHFERKLHNRHALKDVCPTCDPNALCKCMGSDSPAIVGKHDVVRFGRIWLCLCCDCQLSKSQIDNYCTGKGFFTSWQKVPPTMKTWSQWENLGRVVRPRSRATGRVLSYKKGHDRRWIDLYRVDQTVLASE